MYNNYLSPKCGLIFKRIFGDEKNVDILVEFLQAVLDIHKNELEKITIADPRLQQGHSDDWLPMLALELKMAGGTSMDVEMQLLTMPEQKEFLEYDILKMAVAQLDSVMNHGSAKRVIRIAITDFHFINDSGSYHQIYRFYDEAAKSLYMTEIIMLELPKLPEQEENNELWRWMQFFKEERKEAFEMLAAKNKGIGKAVAALAELSQDKKMRLAYEYEEKVKRVYVSTVTVVKNEIARKMKESGEEMSKIILYTGLAEDEINNL